jgi:hypothetical protein
MYLRLSHYIPCTYPTGVLNYFFKIIFLQVFATFDNCQFIIFDTRSAAGIKNCHLVGKCLQELPTCKNKCIYKNCFLVGKCLQELPPCRNKFIYENCHLVGKRLQELPPRKCVYKNCHPVGIHQHERHFKKIAKYVQTRQRQMPTSSKIMWLEILYQNC